MDQRDEFFRGVIEARKKTPHPLAKKLKKVSQEEEKVSYKVNPKAELE